MPKLEGLAFARLRRGKPALGRRGGLRRGKRMTKECGLPNDEQLYFGLCHSSLFRVSSFFSSLFRNQTSTFGTCSLRSCSMLTILFLGDIVGEPGRNAVIARLPELKEQHGIDFIVVNGENAAGGRGITGKMTIDLLRAGASVVTTGDHIWDQKDILSFIDTEPRLLRPVNYPA